MGDEDKELRGIDEELIKTGFSNRKLVKVGKVDIMPFLQLLETKHAKKTDI